MMQVRRDRLLELSKLPDLSPRERELLLIAVEVSQERREMSARLDDLKLELSRSARALCDERLERYKLKLFLREAIRNWVRLTPDVEDAVTAWNMARHADLTQ